jgi:hypothetical protein
LFAKPFGTAVIGSELFVCIGVNTFNQGAIYEWPTNTSGAVGLSPTRQVGESPYLIYPIGLHRDNSNNLWAANSFGSNSSLTPSVVMYPNTAGLVAPAITIAGAATLLGDPWDVYWFNG